MCSPPTLTSLPEELVEFISQELELEDLCSLRLTNAQVASKASRGHFRSHFVVKRAKATQKTFRYLASATGPGRLGCLLEDLSLVCIVSSKESEHPGARDSEEGTLLSKAMNNVRNYSKLGRLRSLSVTVEGTGKKRLQRRRASPSDPVVHTWRDIRACTGRIESFVFQAVKASSLCIDNLDLYSSTVRCATSVSRTQALCNAFNTSVLQDLSLVLSDDEADDVSPENRTLSHDLSQLTRLLSHFQLLKRLDLRWFDLCVPRLRSAESMQRFVIAGLATLTTPSLVIVALRGLKPTAEDLSKFILRNPQIEDLSLEGLHLELGKFESVLTHIADIPALFRLYLSDLSGHSEKTLQFLDATGERHYWHRGPPTWIERHGPEARLPTRYKAMRERIYQHPSTDSWFGEKMDRYGPP